ncbi:MAG TPA: DUF4157 domain-containing protein [Stellaceae bacterium]|jgi:hypothetical protein|nr:DUF4157 domain-containing protein [Stellaceae bacterium]
MSRFLDTLSPDRSERDGSSRSARDRDNASPRTAAPGHHGLGNRALLSLMRAKRLQPKARLSGPGDAAEIAADRAAETVLARPLRENIGGSQVLPELQRAEPPATAIAPLSGGRSLDPHIRAPLEARFGEDFADVRIHTGDHAGKLADNLDARAFTTGRDIVFGDGEFAPGTMRGQRLLAHELAHVVQQRPAAGGGGAALTGSALAGERDAREAAAAVASGDFPSIRERAAPGSVQKELKDLPTGQEPGVLKYMDPTFDWTITVDGRDVVKVYGLNPGDEPKPRAWEDTDTRILYVDPGSSHRAEKTGNGRWNDVVITSGKPHILPPVLPKPPPQHKPAPKQALPPKTVPVPKRQEQPPEPDIPPGAQEVPEIVITADEALAEPMNAEADGRPVGEQVLTALSEDPATAARLAPQLTDAELEQFDPKDRSTLLNALAADANGHLDTETVLRVLQTTPGAQQQDLLKALVAEDGKVLAALRASVSPGDRTALENGLFQLQLANDWRNGPGTGPNLFDPLGARGFTRPIWSKDTPSWARDLQFRSEANGDWTLQAPGQNPLIIEGLLSRERRAEALNEQIASYEARMLSPSGKIDRIKQLADNNWTGSGDEERIINILHYTSADEAKSVLEALKTTKSGGVPLIDKLDQVVDLDNNVLVHTEIAALRLRARKDDPKLVSDLAKAPVLPWRDAFFHNRAVFTLQTAPDGRIAVTYGALQSYDLEASEAFGAAMRALPKDMQHGGTLFLQPDDIVIVNDVDGNRQVPLTAADLVAFQHSGNRGMLKHMGNVASVVVPVGLAARGTIGLGQAAVEVGTALATMTADEYRMEITKWSPALMGAIDIANVALALKGGVDLAKLGKTGVSAVYSRLKTQYAAFKSGAALKMAASGVPNAVHAAQLADAQAQSLLHELEQIQNGTAPKALPPGPQPFGLLPPGPEPYGLLPPAPQPFGLLPPGPHAPKLLPAGPQPFGLLPPGPEPFGLLPPAPNPPQLLPGAKPFGLLSPGPEPPKLLPAGRQPLLLGPGPGPSLVAFDQETIDSLVQMWQTEIANRPERAADFRRYIRNLNERRSLLSTNRGGGLSRLGEQSEREIQFLTQSRQARVRTPDGVTVPDFTQGTDWGGDVKNWNILYPTETELNAAAQGRRPAKLQDLVDQVATRRFRYGNNQTIVIDIRGQLSLQGVSPAEAANNRWVIHQFGRVVADATGLPIEQIQVVTW